MICEEVGSTLEIDQGNLGNRRRFFNLGGIFNEK